MRERGRWDGVRAIASFNWWWYLAAGLALAIAGSVLALADGETSLVACAWLVLASSAWFLLSSLAASHWIYDRSDLHRFGWLHRVLAGRESTAPGGSRFVFCHAGYDECSAELRQRMPQSAWRLLDHFDRSTMSEASIRRARRLHPVQPETVAAPFGAWPVPDAWADAVFAVLAIHELRGEDQRVAWFAEARRCLARDGRVLLIEQVRDVANFLAFGPGCLHFHSPATWRRAWTAAGFLCCDGFRITPFVRVFVLRDHQSARRQA